jgi:hypothetical protein
MRNVAPWVQQLAAVFAFGAVVALTSRDVQRTMRQAPLRQAAPPPGRPDP